MFEDYDNDRLMDALEELRNKAIDLAEKSKEIPGMLSDAAQAGARAAKSAGEKLGIDRGIEKGKEAIQGVLHRYGDVPKEMLDLYHQLDDEDRAIIRGEMRAMLRDKKYMK